LIPGAALTAGTERARPELELRAPASYPEHLVVRARVGVDLTGEVIGHSDEPRALVLVCLGGRRELPPGEAWRPENPASRRLDTEPGLPRADGGVGLGLDRHFGRLGGCGRVVVLVAGREGGGDGDEGRENVDGMAHDDEAARA